MKTLYVLGLFNKHGAFIKYVRKGSGLGKLCVYDDTVSARKGLADSNKNKFSDRNYKLIELKFNIDEADVLESI